MPRDHGVRPRVLALITASLTFSHCGQGEDLAGPDPAALQVTTATAGPGTDPDGYTVSLDGRAPVRVALTDTLVENGVTPGEHTVELGDLAQDCAVEGGTFRTLSAVNGTTVSVDFSVTCGSLVSPQGSVLVAVTTIGGDLDADGYLIGIDPSIVRAVGSSDQIRIEGIAAGQQLVRLSGVSENCSVQGENPATVDVPPGGEAATSFVVRCWPPASGKIAFVMSSSVQIVSPGGVPLDTLALESVSSSSWSPDGAFIALAGASMLIQPASGGAAMELPGCLPSGSRPVWSPDGNRLLCLSEEGRLSSVGRDGSGSRFLTPQNGSRVISAQYLPDNRVFFFAEVQGEGFVASRVDDDGTNLIRLFVPPDEINEATVVPSPDGQHVAYVVGFFLGQLYVARTDGADARVIALDLDVSNSAPEWSPDGGRIAFLAGDSFPRSDLWLVNRDGTDLVKARLPAVPDGPLGAGVPDWSPDGTRLTVDFTDTDLLTNIFTVRADGSGLQQLTTSGDAKNPAWGR
jgi:Tol biopolymer transport system component